MLLASRVRLQVASTGYLMIRTLVGGVGGFTFFATTNNVTLCAGSIATKLVPLMVTSARRVMVLAAVSCQTCVVPR